MQKILIIYSAAIFFVFIGVLLLKSGLKKQDFKDAIRNLNYRPIRNYGKTFSIMLGVLCIILGLSLLFLNPI